MKELIRLREAARMQRERYEIYKDHSDALIRRKAHLELDRFLMEHRETAIILMTEGLDQVLSQEKVASTKHPSSSLWRRLLTFNLYK